MRSSDASDRARSFQVSPAYRQLRRLAAVRRLRLQLRRPADPVDRDGADQARVRPARLAARPAQRPGVRGALLHARHPDRAAGRLPQPRADHRRVAGGLELVHRGHRLRARLLAPAVRARRRRHRRGRLQPARVLAAQRLLRAEEARDRAVDLLDGRVRRRRARLPGRRPGRAASTAGARRSSSSACRACCWR